MRKIRFSRARGSSYSINNNHSYLKIILDKINKKSILFKMEKVAKILKGRNIRATNQRILVYKLLSENLQHFTVEKIYEKIRKSIPVVSLATVYAVLDLFKDKGLIEEIRIKSDRASYSARVCIHHHFLCRECNMIFDIDILPCPTLKKKKVNGHKIEELQGYFYGICKKCLGK